MESEKLELIAFRSRSYRFDKCIQTGMIFEVVFCIDGDFSMTKPFHLSKVMLVSYLRNSAHPFITNFRSAMSDALSPFFILPRNQSAHQILENCFARFIF